jgi:hypothetical protein
MSYAYMVCRNAIAFNLLLLASIGYSNAGQAGIANNECLLEVREAMSRAQIKKLYTADQNRVNSLCNEGDTESALTYVALIGALKKCVRDIDEYIEKNFLDVTKDTLRAARLQCRQSGLLGAVEVLNAEPVTSSIDSSAKIISFVASADVIEKGGSIILSWSTEKANTVMLGRNGETDFVKVQASGSRSVTPDDTSTYVLMAGQSTKGPTTMTSRKLTVTVSESPAGTCSIEGLLNGAWQQQVKERLTEPSSTWTVGVGIYISDSDSPFAITGASVNNHGEYSVSNLIAGKTYTVRPSWASTPREGSVSCTKGRVHIGPKFKITGGPKYD